MSAIATTWTSFIFARSCTWLWPRPFTPITPIRITSFGPFFFPVIAASASAPGTDAAAAAAASHMLRSRNSRRSIRRMAVLYLLVRTCQDETHVVGAHGFPPGSGGFGGNAFSRHLGGPGPQPSGRRIPAHRHGPAARYG